MGRQFRRFSNTRLARIDAKMNDRRLMKKKEKYIQARLEQIGGGYKGKVHEFEDTVLPYWKKYGVKPSRSWYELYCDGQDAFDPRYLTDLIWILDIIPYFNNMKMRVAYDDKGMYHRLFGDAVRMPETVVKRMGGHFYNGDGEEPITREEAKALCEREEHLIFKPSMESWGGKGIAFYDRDRKNQRDLDDLLNNSGLNYVAQRVIKQHPDLAKINEDSINTVRIVTFRFHGQIYVLSAILRMGGTGSRVDNISAGGCACAVKPDGRLFDKAVVRKGDWSDQHPSGILFKNIQIPNYDIIIETAKRLHNSLPHFNIIGWDFAVDENSNPVLIEFNINPAQNQIASKQPTFGDMTDEVLDEVFIKQSMKKKSDDQIEYAFE